MSERPRLLDLFCKAGGASRGYQLAGFHVTGVDLEPQPRHCGDAFVQADALEYLAEHGGEYDAIHASPPCRGYSVMRNLPWLRDREYPLLILPTRILLEGIGKPYVIENVMGARWGNRQLQRRGLREHGMKAGYLCGLMFGLPFYRRRLFETSGFWLQPGHPRHRAGLRHGGPLGDRGRTLIFTAPHRGGRASGTEAREPVQQGRPAAWQHVGNGAQRRAVGIGHAAGWRDFARIVGIDWMTREEVCNAIPPVYTAFIGQQLRTWLEPAPGQK